MNIFDLSMSINYVSIKGSFGGVFFINSNTVVFVNSFAVNKICFMLILNLNIFLSKLFGCFLDRLFLCLKLFRNYKFS